MYKNKFLEISGGFKNLALLLAMLFLIANTARAQSYVWAINNGTTMTVANRNTLVTNANGNGMVSFYTTAGNGVITVHGASGTIMTGGTNHYQVFDSSGKAISAGATQGNGTIYDPVNPNVKYVVSSNSVKNSSTLTVNGWPFKVPFADTVAGGTVLCVIKQTFSGSSWATNWVRFVTTPSGVTGFGNGLTPILGASGSITHGGNYSFDVTQVGGVTKLAVGFRSSRVLSNEEMNVYSNGLLSNAVTNFATPAHTVLALSGATLSSPMAYFALQFDGSNGTPEFMSTIVDTLGSYKGSDVAGNYMHAPQVKYEPGGSLLMMPYLAPPPTGSTGVAARFVYRNYTDASGTPVSSTYLGGWATSSTAAHRYALLKLSNTDGSIVDKYTTNLGSAAGNGTNFVPGYLEVDSTHAYIVGVTQGGSSIAYTPGGTATLSGTSQLRDFIVVKLRHSGGTMQPELAARYGSSGSDTRIDAPTPAGGGVLEFRGQTALDKSNKYLYFLMKPAAAFTSGTATVGLSGAGGGCAVLRLNTNTLGAVDAINLIGTSSLDPAKNIQTYTRITAIAVNPVNKRLMLTGMFYQSADLKVNGTVIKSLSYYNATAPYVLAAQDGFFLSVDIPTSTVVPSTYCGASARSTNLMNSTAVKAGGASVFYGGTFYGDFTWDGTALGGTSGALSTENYTNGILVEADAATGTVLRAIMGQDANYGSAVDEVKVNPYDGYIYVLQHPISYYVNNMRPLGNGAPLISFTGKVSYNQIVYLTKINPANFDHVWTTMIQTNLFGNPPIDTITGMSGRDANPSNITFDPATGAVFVGGFGTGHSYSARTSAFSANLTHPYNQTDTFDNTATMSLISHTPAWNTHSVNALVNYFVAKFDKDGNYQAGGTFSSTGATSSTSYPVFLEYMNNKLYVATAANGTGNIIYNKQGFTRSSYAVNGTTIYTSIAAGKEILFSLDASLTGDPILKRDFASLPVSLGGIAANNGTGQLYLGHSLSGNGRFGGDTAIRVGSTDILIHEIDTATLADVASGNILIGGSGTETMRDMKVDNSGKIFYAGSTNSAAFPITTPGGSINTNPTTGGTDYLVGSTDPNNFYKPVFAFVSGSTNSESAYSIAPGNAGTVFVGGDLKGAATFGTTTIDANSSGDFLFGRIDYPYQGPGAINAGLDTWFDAGFGTTVSSGSLTTLTNKNTPSAPNVNFISMSNVGTVAYDTPTVSSYGANYNPSFLTSTGNTLTKTSLGAGVFTNSGLVSTYFAVVKTTDSTSNILNWKETTTNSELNIGAKQVKRVNSAGTTVTLNATTKVPDSKWSLVSLNVPSNGVMVYALNGKANGTATSTGALNTAVPGTFTVGGGTGTQIAEVATYSTTYALSSNQYRQIATYFALKYGITLDTSFGYRSGSGVVVYDHTKTGTEKAFPYNVAGIMRDDVALLNKRQAAPANNSILGMGAGNQIAMSEEDNTVVINDGDYLIFGSDTAVNYIGNSKVASLPPGVAFCEGKSLEKTWRVKMRLPYSGRNSELKKTKLVFKLSQAGNVVANNSVPSAAASYKLIVDRNDNQNYSDAVDQMYTATTMTQTAGVDDEVVFENVEFDADSSGSDQFALVWQRDGADASLYTTTGTSDNLTGYCTSAGYRYYRDPLATNKSYVVINPNSNASYGPSDIRVTKRAALRYADYYTGAGNNRYAVLMPYMINVVDAVSYTTGGGAIVRFFYDPAVKTSVDTVYRKDSAWIYFPGSVAALEAAFDTNAHLPSATYLTPVQSGITTGGLGFVDLKIPSGGTVAHIGYQTTVGIEPCQIYYGADSFSVYAGLHFFAKDVNNTVQLDNMTGNPVTPSPALTPTGVNNIQYQASSSHWYGWDGTNWLQIDNATNTEAVPNFTLSVAEAGKILPNRGHVWGWTGTAWKQLDE